MGPPADQRPFRCRVTPSGHTVHVAAVGELDLETAGQVEAQLAAVRGEGFETVVLDLRETAFMDSAGLHLVLGWHERAGRERFGFALIDGPRAVRRVMDAAGVRPLLTFVD